FMIDASSGFTKDGSKNRLREQDIHKIVDVFVAQAERARYSRMVPTAEIAANGYNLNLPRYIDASPALDFHDLDGHLRVGIPLRDVDDLNPYWEVFPSLRDALFGPDGPDGYARALVGATTVMPTIVADE